RELHPRSQSVLSGRGDREAPVRGPVHRGEHPARSRHGSSDRPVHSVRAVRGRRPGDRGAETEVGAALHLHRIGASFRRMLTSAAAVLFAGLFLAPVPAHAFGKNKIVYEKFDWHIYRSPHFDVYYYPEEESLLQEIVSDAESQYTRLSQILDHEIKFR